MRILVAYATDHGSARGVADRIAGQLRQHGADADACAVTDAPEVSGYEAVILGSAIQGGKWLPSARQFADRNAAPLRERRAFFLTTGGRYGDHRNWPAIDAWANHIAGQLHAISSTRARREHAR